MDERQKLIERIQEIYMVPDVLSYEQQIGLLADFILQDRKRVVAPLLEPHTIHKGNELDTCIKAIKQTLSNAGVAQ